jgi:tRNA pseudouridine38-40 synthase
MRNIKITVEYDGTEYRGWQIQPDEATIEGVLRKSIETIVREKITLISSSRTDAGVHALGHVVNFHCNTPIHLSRIQHSLNSILPVDIACRDVEEVPAQFHARYDAVGKQYRYTVSTGKHPLTRKYVWRINRVPDLNILREACSILTGKKDYRAFCRRRDLPPNSICDVAGVTLEERQDYLVFDIKADRFLHNMVRIMIGTIFAAGWGEMKLEDIEILFREGDRRNAGPTAPSCGLLLVKVFYNTAWY